MAEKKDIYGMAKANHEALKELVKQTAELAKQMKEFKETYQKWQKAGKF